uniref:non-specific serine/threonine protein kinase n=3 Tax=Parascaris univalens TaxID=6257 RepID=A0A915BKS1_PARUN
MNANAVIRLYRGEVIGKRWKVLEKLGEGGCGYVYKVKNIRTGLKAALKAESNFVVGGSVLKLEVQVLKRLAGRMHVAQLLQSARKETYSYMVMTLFGRSLNALLPRSGQTSVSTQVRVGIQILYGIKQLHEVGYVHRDVKPANLLVGRRGREARFVHLLDFGLAREYVLRSDGTVKIRVPRTNTLFRGTTRYCSVNAHMRGEQGRPDDLWSMAYVLAEMRDTLPWHKLTSKDEIGDKKKSTPDSMLFNNSPKQLLDITTHLRSLNYYTRPDYFRIYKDLDSVMEGSGFSFGDPFDWEVRRRRTIRRKRKPKIFQALKTVSTQSLTGSTDLDEMRNKMLGSSDESSLSNGNVSVEKTFMFTPEDFKRNEIGL